VIRLDTPHAIPAISRSDNADGTYRRIDIGAGPTSLDVGN
jgi:hypothetical protein